MYSSGEELGGGGGGGVQAYMDVYSCVNVKPSVDGIFSPVVLCIV